MKTLDYNEAKQLVNEFCKLAEQNESLFFSYGFLQSFAAQCLSGRHPEHSRKVMDKVIEDMKHTTAPVPTL